MSSQKGNVSRSRGQKHQNAVAFKNDKYGATVQVKKANSKIHDGLCQHCKDVLEWKVKYSKYKSLTQPRKCVKCSQKTVKDAYHVICNPCSLHLEICCKCGKKEDIVLPVKLRVDKKEDDADSGEKKKRCRKGEEDMEDLDSDDKEVDFGGDDEDFDGNIKPKRREKKADVLPDLSPVNLND